MISSIHLVNFKGHRDTRLDLGRMTAILGPNGSGKTSVLQAMMLAGEWTRRDKASRGISLDFFQEYVRIGEAKASIGLSIQGKKAPIRFDVTPDDPCISGPGFSDIHLQNTTGLRESSLSVSRDLLGEIRYLKLNGSALAEPCYTDELQPRIASDGSGLASALSYLMTSEPETFHHIVERLKAVAPAVGRVRSRRSKVVRQSIKTLTVGDKVVPYNEDQAVVGDELLFDMNGASGLPASQIGEGMLVTLGILTAIHQSTGATVVLVDDIEQGLHPRAQRELIVQLDALLDQQPQLQIVATSHSPYIVDEMEANDVWLLAADEDGISHAKRLSDHPEATQWLEVLSTGEFWSAEGEDWVTADGSGTR